MFSVRLHDAIVFLASDGEALYLDLFSVSQHIAKHGFSVRSSMSNS
jgi:hypothetical protein